jgi:hypothetical protein
MVPVDEGVAYDLRIRAVSDVNTVGDWTTVFGHVVVGASTPPPDVLEFFIERGNVLTWLYPNPPRDFAGFLLRYHQGSNGDWDSANPVHDGFISDTRYDVSTITAGETTFLLKAVDMSGNESVNAAFLIKDIEGPERGHPVGVYDAENHVPSWWGLIFNADYQAGPGEWWAKTDTDGFWSANDTASFWTNDLALFWTQSYLGINMYLNIDNMPADATLYPITVTTDIDAEAEGFRLRYRNGYPGPEFQQFPGFAILEAPPAAGYFQLHIATDPGALQSKIKDVFLNFDVPIVRNYIENVATPLGGVIVPPTVAFHTIVRAFATVQFDGAGGFSVVITKQAGWAQAGATIEVFDAAGAAVTGTIDVEYVGY